jgi:hypothetical protein
MVFALLLGRGDGSGRRSAARIVPILHAFLEESITRRALQSLLIRPELAGRHFLLRINCKTWPRRQEHNQSGSQKRATRHAEPPEFKTTDPHQSKELAPKIGTESPPHAMVETRS